MLLPSFALTVVSNRRSDTFVVRYVAEFICIIFKADHILI